MLSARGGTVLGIDVKENSGAALKAVDEFGLTFPNLRDRDGSFVREWGQTGYPENYVIDRAGPGRRRPPLPGHAEVARRDAPAAARREGVMRALLATLLALALLASPAAAAAPRASLPDIEDEVMCLECGTALNVSTSDVADQERDFIAELIAEGRTKAEIKAALVDEYGPRVLAEPAGRRLPAHRLGRARCSRRSARWRSSCSSPAAGAARDARRRPPASGPGARRRRRAPARRRARGLRPMSDGVDTTVVAAFAVGFVSFISPCVLPLVPGYLSAVSGVSVAELQRGERSLLKVLLPAIVFCLSFTVVFVALGMTATGPRLGAAGLPRHARQDRRRGHHRARRAVPAHAVRAQAQPRVAARRADQPRRLGRPADRRRGVRVRLDAVHRPDARRDPHRRLDAGQRSATARSCCCSTRSG